MDRPCDACTKSQPTLIRLCCCPLSLCIVCFRRHVRYCAFLDDNPSSWPIYENSEETSKSVPSAISLSVHLNRKQDPPPSAQTVDAWTQTAATLQETTPHSQRPFGPHKLAGSVSKTESRPEKQKTGRPGKTTDPGKTPKCPPVPQLPLCQPEPPRLRIVTGSHFDINGIFPPKWLGKATELGPGFAYHHDLSKPILNSVAPPDKVLAMNGDVVYEVFWSSDCGGWTRMQFLTNVQQFHQLPNNCYLLMIEDRVLHVKPWLSGNWKVRVVSGLVLLPGTAVAVSGPRLYVVGGTSLLSHTPSKVAAWNILSLFLHGVLTRESDSELGLKRASL